MKQGAGWKIIRDREKWDQEPQRWDAPKRELVVRFINLINGNSPSICQQPVAPQPVQTPTYWKGTRSGSSQDMNAAASSSRPTVMIPSWVQRIQKPRNSPAFKIPGVSTSTTSGLLRFFRITDLVFFQPPRNTSTIGFASEGPVVKARWASCSARTLKRIIPPENGWNWYSSLSSVLKSAEEGDGLNNIIEQSERCECYSQVEECRPAF